MRRPNALLFSLVALAILPAALACFGRFSDERELCETYLDCLAAEDLAQIPAATAAYGDDSPCWNSRSDAERCASACEAGILAFPRCELPASHGDGRLSAEQFRERFSATYCAQLELCSDGERSCSPGSDDDSTDYQDCQYNPVAAEACLEGNWTCTEPSEHIPSFPEVPVICGQVFDCPNDN